MSGSAVAPTVPLMTEFLVELYLPPTVPEAVEHLARCARVAAEEQRVRGVPVRYVRSISVPEEQTYFVFYDAPSREAASETARLARFAAVCIAASETTETRHEDIPSRIGPANSELGGPEERDRRSV